MATIIRESYLKKIRKFIDEEEIKVITGLRRSGKTYFLKQIMNELKEKGINDSNIVYLPLESAKYDTIKNYKDLNNLIFNMTKDIKGKIYLFFDEIQLINDWQKSINSYRIDLDADIYLTGSNSQLLSGELATLLSGRYIKIEIYPFSFNEILEYKKIKFREISLSDETKIFNKYMKYGGLPRTLNFDEEEKIDYLSDIYSTIVLKDIISKNNIRDIAFLERLIKFMIVNTGEIFSINSIRKYLKHEGISVSTNTISNYLKHIEDAYILIKSKREEIKTKKILTTNEKYYCIDQGFYELQTGFNKSREKILENIVFLELLRRKYKITVGNIDGLEVDFICRKPNKTIYIQVSESILDETTRNREFRSLEKINDNYPKYVLTLDNWDYSKNGIIHLNIINFLKDTSI
ncbi:MAG: ATP-binding protein [Methanobrevibacter millerae]|uniref:ATP-binding protein n=1 Tax=Methanobrevibacter millerae TaxID=230361 RepID=A0A8T3VQB0_9EURY|nr:ATP-binding protein [Methanobrevibacter millerae]